MLAYIRLATHSSWAKGLAVLALIVLASFLRSVRGSANDFGTTNQATKPDTVGWVGRYTSLELDALGYPVVSYYDETNGDLKLLHCGDALCNAANSIVSPDTGFLAGQHTSLELDASGNPVVGYQVPRLGTDADLKILHCGDPNCASGNSIVVADTSGNFGSYSSLALDASGNPVVSYLDGINRDLKVLHCGDPDCASGNNISAPDTTGDVGYKTSLTLDVTGNPVVSYSTFDQGVKLLHCGNASCTGGNSIVTLDLYTFNAVSTSLALDTAGNPVVAYVGRTAYFQPDLRVLHCGNPDCSAGNVSASLQEGVAGDLSLELNAVGWPVISYLEFSPAYRLKLAYCGDGNCSSGNRVVVADAEGPSGSYSSLALNASGLPVVSFYVDGGDVRNDLKLLFCGQPDCWSDQDKDTCPGASEQQTDAGTETLGGRRDPLNHWDYFNP
ncbi:MAG: hypothetical protein ACREMY_07815, partial [bacterium]